MLISDWSSDVCSSDLGQADQHRNRYGPKQLLVRVIVIEQGTVHAKYSRHQLDFGAELVRQYAFLRNRIILARKDGRDVGEGTRLIPAANRTIDKEIFSRCPVYV